MINDINQANIDRAVDELNKEFPVGSLGNKPMCLIKHKSKK